MEIAADAFSERLALVSRDARELRQFQDGGSLGGMIGISDRSKL